MPIGTAIDTSKLKLTFQDEFTTLSASSDGSTGLWQTSLDYGNRTLGSNGELQYYSDSSVGVDPFTIRNGVLDIKAAPGSNPLGLPYNSGAIISKASFTQLYGYFEIRAQMPAGQGIWPAFWLLPADGSWPPELDIFEVLGHDPTTLYFSTHSSVQATQGTTLHVENVTQGFHTYGVMWGPTNVKMYIDGIEVAQMPTPADMNKPMYMLANLAVGGYWPGVPDGTTPFPAHLLIDYVHAYAYPGTSGGTVVNIPPSANVGPTNVAPVVSTPATIQSAKGATIALAGVSITDTWPGGLFTATVSSSRGTLHTAGTTGVIAQGENSAVLTLTGTLAAINADLKSLAYKASTTEGTDWIWVSVKDPQGQQGLGSIIAKTSTGPIITPPPTTGTVPFLTTPAALTLAVGTTAKLANVHLSGGTAAGTLTVTVSDNHGLLRTHASTGVIEHGEGTNSLTLTGNLAAINAELATLTYQAAATAGTEWLWVSVTDIKGQQNVSPVVVTVTAPTTPPPAQDPVPVLKTPSTLTLSAGSTQALQGITVSGASANAELTVVVSDSHGRLDTRATPGVKEHGEHSTNLTLTGKLAAINAQLATLTYNASGTRGTDWLWVSATDAKGHQSISPVVVTVTPPPAAPDPSPVTKTPSVVTPAAMIMTAGAMRALPDIRISADRTGGDLTVVISDGTGHLHTKPTAGVTTHGNHSTNLTLTGSLAAINAGLATLTYKAAPKVGTDWLWVSVTDGNDQQSTSPVVVTIRPPSRVQTTDDAQSARSSHAPLPAADTTVALGHITRDLTAPMRFLQATQEDTAQSMSTGDHPDTTDQHVLQHVGRHIATLPYPSDILSAGQNALITPPIELVGSAGGPYFQHAVPVFAERTLL